MAMAGLIEMETKIVDMQKIAELAVTELEKALQVARAEAKYCIEEKKCYFTQDGTGIIWRLLKSVEKHMVDMVSKVKAQETFRPPTSYVVRDIRLVLKILEPRHRPAWNPWRKASLDPIKTIFVDGEPYGTAGLTLSDIKDLLKVREHLACNKPVTLVHCQCYRPMQTYATVFFIYTALKVLSCWKMLLDSSRDNSFIYLAAMRGDKSSIAAYLEKYDKGGPLENSRLWDLEENTCYPLQIAAYNGHKHIVQMLVESGCPFEHPDGLGPSPLYIAVLMDHMSVAELLMKRGAVSTTADNEQYSPLHIALIRDQKKLINFLRSSICTLKSSNNDMLNSFQMAFALNRTSCLNAMLYGFFAVTSTSK